MVKLPSMLADRPLELHVGSAPALSDTRGKQPKPRNPIGAELSFEWLILNPRNSLPVII